MQPTGVNYVGNTKPSVQNEAKPGPSYLKPLVGYPEANPAPSGEGKENSSLDKESDTSDSKDPDSDAANSEATDIENYRPGESKGVD